MVQVQTKIHRPESQKLRVRGSPPPIITLLVPEMSLLTLEQVIVVGAGLGGLGAAVGILLAGHEVIVLEAAKEVGEVFPDCGSVNSFITDSFLGRCWYSSAPKLLPHFAIMGAWTGPRAVLHVAESCTHAGLERKFNFQLELRGSC